MSLAGRAVALVRRAAGALMPVSSAGGGGWFPIIRESFAGAWQRNIEVTADTALAFHAVYACVTLIAADIGKLRPRLMQQSKAGLWAETSSPAFSPVLAKPNRFQNHIQFKEYWITSKLIRGNAYVLLERDNRQVVRAMYLLDPSRVQVLVAADGSVYYDIGQDNLSQVPGTHVRVPASEIIHDRMNCLFHPLVGISPLFAAGMAAEQGLRIQRNSAAFFGNNSMPGGVLLAPKSISDENAKEIKDYWSANFTGGNAGKIAVLGDGMTFSAMRMTAVDSQLIEQLKWSAEVVCSTFHVPAFMIGSGTEPAYSNGETRTGHYYSQCLQSLIESMELSLDEGLGLDTPKDGTQYGAELDLGGLLRMDSATQVKTLSEAVAGAIMTPNEGRAALNLEPLPGGNTIYMQQQNYSLSALAKRDANDPFPTPAPPAPPPAPTPEPALAPAPAAKDIADAIEARRMAEIERAAADEAQAVMRAHMLALTEAFSDA